MEAENLKITYKKKGDEYLWSKFKEGDRDALDKIYYSHVPAMIAYSHQFTRRKEVVDDCIQELFIDLWQKRNRLSETTSIRFYLLKCLKRRILRNLKKSEKFKEFGEFSDVFLEKNVQLIRSQEPEPRISSDKLNQAFRALSPLQRELIYLKYYNNLTCDQMKDLLELTKKQVYNALSKAMITLRQNLAAS